MKFASVRKYFPQIFAAVPGLLTILAGSLQTGWTSPAINEFLSGNGTLTLTHDEAYRITTALKLGAAVGPFFMLVTADILGRKFAMLVAMIPSILGWVLTAVATNVYFLYTAKFIAGLGSGFSITIVPIYLGEISSDSIRGCLTTMSQVMISLGPIIQYAIVPVLNARIAAYISILVPWAAVCLLYWIPESPYYLLIKKREPEARTAFGRLRAGTNVDEECEKAREVVEKQMGEKRGFIDLVTKSYCRNGFLLICAMLTINILSGLQMVIMYSHTMLNSISTDLPINALALSLVIVPFVTTLISSGIVDYVGKKPLFFVSIVGSFLSTIIIAIYYHFKYLGYDVTEYMWFPVVFLILYKMFVGLAIATFGFVFLGELLSTNIKVYGATISKSYFNALIMTQNEVFKYVFGIWGFHVPFYIFAAGNFIGFFYLFVMPETKGKSLQEIQVLLGATF